MRTAKPLDLGMEAIAPQSQSMLFKELTLQFRDMKELAAKRMTEVAHGRHPMLVEDHFINQADLIEYGQRLEKIVATHTGIRIKVEFYAGGYEMMTDLVYPSANNPFTQGLRSWFKGKDIEKLYGVGENIDRRMALAGAEIDRVKGRVGGTFSSITFAIGVGIGLLANPAMRLTEEQLAAVFLHEVGHAFTILERTLYTVTANVAIQTASEALGNAEAEERVRIIKQFADSHGMEVDADALAQKDRKTFEMVAVRNIIAKRLPSATGARGYEMTGKEFSADQFVARHGAAVPLATAVNKMSADGDLMSRSKLAHVATETLKFCLWTLMAIGTMGVVLIFPLMMLVWARYEDRVYDTPVDRMNRMKQDLVQSLKIGRLAPEHRQKLLSDIEAIDRLIGTSKDYRTLWNLVWSSLSPSRRRAYDDRVFQQELEQIINNDLFVSASKLSLLFPKK